MPAVSVMPRGLTRRQKAAVIVRLLLSEGADLSLVNMPESLIAELSRQLAGLRYVDRETVDAVVDEFLGEIDTAGLSFPQGLEAAFALLDQSITTESATRLRQQAGLSAQGDPWDRVCSMSTEVLLPALQQESMEVGAVLLSKLKVSKAAELLGMLPGEKARRITFAMSLTGSIAPKVVARIGVSLANQLDAQPEIAFSDGPVERVGAILNFSPAATRDDVLKGLQEDDSGFADQVRRAIFTFANIPTRIDPRDIPKIIRDIDPAQLITALAAATGDLEAAGEFILTNMSQRMAAQLRDEITARGNVKAKDGEDAMNAVVATIRDQEAAGEIMLVAEDE